MDAFMNEKRLIPHESGLDGEDCDSLFEKTVTGTFWKCLRCGYLILAEKGKDATQF